MKSDVWDAAAVDYDDLAYVVTGPFICDVIGHLPPAKHLERVLDCATGTGYFPLKLISHINTVKELLATDFSPKMVEILQRKLPGNSVVKATVMDAQDLSPLPSEYFDLVSCFFGAMFFSDCKKALEEFQRVLKPRTGVLVLTTWKEVGFNRFFEACKRRLQNTIVSPSRQMPLQSNSECLNEVRSAGFTNVRCFNVHRRVDVTRDLLLRTGLTNPVLRNTNASDDAKRVAIMTELDVQFPHGGDCTFDFESIVTLAQRP